MYAYHHRNDAYRHHHLRAYRRSHEFLGPSVDATPYSSVHDTSSQFPKTQTEVHSYIKTEKFRARHTDTFEQIHLNVNRLSAVRIRNASPANS